VGKKDQELPFALVEKIVEGITTKVDSLARHADCVKALHALCPLLQRMPEGGGADIHLTVVVRTKAKKGERDGLLVREIPPVACSPTYVHSLCKTLLEDILQVLHVALDAGCGSNVVEEAIRRALDLRLAGVGKEIAKA